MCFSLELSVAKKAVRDAAEEVTAVHGEDIRGAETTDSKETTTDLVTAGDRRAEEAIVDRISTHFPEDRLVTEETDGESSDSSGREWVVDPVDGTTNFSLGHRTYGISVAFRKDGEERVGIVAAPALDTVWYAAEGCGEPTRSTLSGSEREGIAVTAKDGLEGAVVAVYDFPEGIREAGGKMRRFGSAAVTLAFVAEGSLDGFTSSYDLERWDTAAGAFLVRQAGGRVSNELGDERLVASNPHIHRRLLEAVA